MKRSLDDKDQQIKMLQELNKILQLQASMCPEPPISGIAVQQ